MRMDEHRDWGWTITNYEAYRITRCAGERKEYNRQKQAEWRARKKAKEEASQPVTPSHSRSQPVTAGHAKSRFAPLTLDEVKLPNVTECYTPEARALLHYLNERSGHHYREVSDSLDRIQRRLNEGVSADDCRSMIDHRCKTWKGTDKAQFLRPSTLFGEKFDEYLGQRDSQIVKTVNGKTVKVGNDLAKLKKELDNIK